MLSKEKIEILESIEGWKEFCEKPMTLKELREDLENGCNDPYQHLMDTLDELGYIVKINNRLKRITSKTYIKNGNVCIDLHKGFYEHSDYWFNLLSILENFPSPKKEGK